MSSQFEQYLTNDRNDAEQRGSRSQGGRNHNHAHMQSQSPSENMPVNMNRETASPTTLQGYELRKEESKKTYGAKGYEAPAGQQQPQQHYQQQHQRHQPHHSKHKHAKQQGRSPSPSPSPSAAASATTPLSTLTSAASISGTESEEGEGDRDLYSLLDLASSPLLDDRSASTSPAAMGTFVASPRSTSTSACEELSDALADCLGDDVVEEEAVNFADGGNGGSALPLLPAEDKLATAKYQYFLHTKTKQAQSPVSSASIKTGSPIPGVRAASPNFGSSNNNNTDNPALELAEAVASNEKSFNRAINNIRRSGQNGQSGSSGKPRQAQKDNTSTNQGKDRHMAPTTASTAALATASSPRSLSSGASQYTDKSFIAIGDIVAASPNVMLERQRQMQATMVELQLELDSARMDRDSLLAVASAAQMDTQVSAAGQAAAAAAATEAAQSTSADAIELEETQRELHELRNILQRKDNSLQTLSNDLHIEREARVKSEEVTAKQVQDYLQRFSSLQIHLELQEERLRNQQQQHEQILQQQEHKYKEQKDKVTAAECSEQSLRQVATTAARASQEHSQQLEIQLALERERTQAIGEDYAALHTQLETQQRQQKAVEEDFAQCRSHLEESRTQVISLQTLLQREGFNLQQHAVETQQLATVVAAAGEDIQRLPVLETALREEQAARASDAQKAQSLLKRQMLALTDADSRSKYWEELSTKQKVYILQLEKSHAEEADKAVVATQELQETQQQLHYWQQHASSATTATTTTDTATATTGSALSPSDLSAFPQNPPSPQASLRSNPEPDANINIQAVEAKAAEQRLQMESAQRVMQEEYASLWVAVQDLNKIDQTKEQAIDLLLREKQDDRVKMHKMHNRYLALQSELKEIDRELLEEARAVGIQFTGSRLLNRSQLAKGEVQVQIEEMQVQKQEHVNAGTEKDALPSPSNHHQLHSHSLHSSVPSVPLLTSAAALTASLQKQKANLTNSGSTPSRRNISTPSGSHSSSSADMALVVEAAAEAQEYDLCRSLDEINSVLEKKVQEKSPHKAHTPLNSKRVHNKC